MSPKSLTLLDFIEAVTSVFSIWSYALGTESLPPSFSIKNVWNSSGRMSIFLLKREKTSEFAKRRFSGSLYDLF